MARVAPLLATAFVITAFASIGLPGLNGFIGEFLVLLGSFGRFPVAVGIATSVVVFSAAYLLVAVQRVFFNPITKPENMDTAPMRRRVSSRCWCPLIAAMVWMGLYPQPILRRTEAAARRYVETVHAVPAASAEPRGVADGEARMMPIDLPSAARR